MKNFFTTIACLAIGLVVAFVSPDGNPASAQIPSSPGRSTPSMQQPSQPVQSIPNRQAPQSQSPARPSAQLNEIDRYSVPGSAQ